MMGKQRLEVGLVGAACARRLRSAGVVCALAGLVLGCTPVLAAAAAKRTPTPVQTVKAATAAPVTSKLASVTPTAGPVLVTSIDPATSLATDIERWSRDEWFLLDFNGQVCGYARIRFEPVMKNGSHKGWTYTLDYLSRGIGGPQISTSRTIVEEDLHGRIVRIEAFDVEEGGEPTVRKYDLLPMEESKAVEQERPASEQAASPVQSVVFDVRTISSGRELPARQLCLAGPMIGQVAVRRAFFARPATVGTELVYADVTDDFFPDVYTPLRARVVAIHEPGHGSTTHPTQAAQAADASRDAPSAPSSGRLVHVSTRFLRPGLQNILLDEQHTIDGHLQVFTIRLGGVTQTMRRATAAEALATLAEPFDGQVLSSTTHIHPERPIQRANAADVIVLDLELITDVDEPFSLIETPFQSVEALPRKPGEPSAWRVTTRRRPRQIKDTQQELDTDQRERYLRATADIDANDEDVRRLANRWKGRATEDWAIARQLVRQTYAKLDKEDRGFLNATDTADTLSGDCTEHSVLLVAMLRSLGIPARAVVGLMYGQTSPTEPASFGYHMWVEAYVRGQWVELDPAWGGLHRVNADRVIFGYSHFDDESSAAEQFGPLSLIENLRVRVVDVIHDQPTSQPTTQPGNADIPVHSPAQ